MCGSIRRFSTANFWPRDHGTTASGTPIRFSFSRVTVNARVSPYRMGRSLESHQLERDRFHTVPCPWNGPTLYEREQCSGKRRKGRIDKGIGAILGGA